MSCDDCEKRHREQQEQRLRYRVEQVLGGTLTQLGEEDGQPVWVVSLPRFTASGTAPSLLQELRTYP